jgi:hypothetical protein
LFKTSLLGGLGRDFSRVLVIIKPQHQIYIVNTKSQTVELPEGLVVAGCGNGKVQVQGA